MCFLCCEVSVHLSVPDPFSLWFDLRAQGGDAGDGGAAAAAAV